MTTLNPEVGHVYAPRGKEGDRTRWRYVLSATPSQVETWYFGDRAMHFSRDDWHAIDWVEITPAPVPPVDAIAVPCDVYYLDGGAVEVVGLSSAPNCPAADCFVTLHIPPKKPTELPAVVVQ